MCRNTFAQFIASSIIVFIPLFGASGQSQARADEKDAQKSASVWMKKKLEFSQHILAGLATGDLDRVSENAQAMKGLNHIEAFVRGRTPGYRSQLQIFEETADEIVRQADKNNLEGATLAFTQLTINCVNCHKQLRTSKDK